MLRLPRPARLVSLACIASLALGVAPAAWGEETKPVIQAGSKVEIEYTLKREGGEVIGTSTEGGPIVFEQGAHQVPPGLEEAVLGLAAGDEKQITLTPEQGFGGVDQALFHTVPVDQVPEEARKPGARLMVRDPQGNPRPLRVHEITDEGIVLDMNHPLAGQTIEFDVKVVSIDSAEVTVPGSPHAAPPAPPTAPSAPPSPPTPSDATPTP